MALLVGVSEGYQNGARMTTDGPMEAMKSYCTTGNLRPGHGSMPQHTAAPFELIIAGQANNYRPKTPVEILLRAKPGKTFKGFFITADGSSSAGAVSGTWNMATPASNITKFCGITGMTHTTNNTKTEVKVMWTPPEGYHYGTIQFKATVVVNYNTFWTGVLSRPLSPPAGGKV
ncbi:hypothetical protein BaRGS_00006960 [Batillaria attramentaria]|uniref:Reelin domain-containing protein n=1 Tax=Batillaria attramentaria TaxID=370345 RepID=A0ABD0LQA8_9CAEN